MLAEISAGDKFTRWTVLYEDESIRYPSGAVVRRFMCKCDCGTERIVPLHGLISETSKSCGCLKNENQKARLARERIDLVGETSGFWSYVKEAGIINHNRYVTCRCVCGTEKDMLANSFLSGVTKSCGCYAKMISAERFRGKSKYIDLTGRQFGRYLVLDLCKEQLTGRLDKRWNIKCTGCGTIRRIRADTLKSLNLPSCACVPKRERSTK